MSAPTLTQDQIAQLFGAAPLHDVFNYNEQQATGGSRTADLEGGGGNTDIYGLPPTNSPEIQRLIDSGAISQTNQNYSNEGGSGTLSTSHVDWSQLPTRGPPGSPYDWAPFHDTGPLYNPYAIYKDPNYGALTPRVNIRPDHYSSWENYIGPVFAAALTLGASAVAGPAFAGVAGLTRAIPAAAGAAGSYLSTDEPNAQAVAWHTQMGNLASKVTTAKPVAGADEASQEQQLPADGYTPENFGNMGSLPAMSDGSQQVATSVAPNAYDNSYNNVVS